MPSLDDAIQFLLDFARNPRSDGSSSYGYEVYLPNAIAAYLREVQGIQRPGWLGQGREAEEVSPVFYDAAWELCRRGIFRPGLKRLGQQTTEVGAGGAGFALTALGRTRLEQEGHDFFIPMEPGRFAQIIARFRARFGDGYFQRAQEATRCHSATAYLASCVMSGAAAESILLRVAIAKTGDEANVLRVYRAASGRSRVENTIVGQLGEPLASRFRSLMDLLKYWRDEAAHGGLSGISEFEAHEAMARLLRLAHFADDHWDELTG